MKTLILSCLLAVVLSQLTITTATSCPDIVCVCRGLNPYLCSLCYDNNRNLSANCANCNIPYTIDPSTGLCTLVNSQTNSQNSASNTSNNSNSQNTTSNTSNQNSNVPAQGSCPVNCWCNTSVCGHCKDPYRSTQTNCTACRDGYIEIFGVCTPLPCPSLCECLGVNPTLCSACIDPRRNISNGCNSCNSAYTVAANGSCVPIPTCPAGCSCKVTPGVCSQCKDPFKSLGSGCKNCTIGYELVPGASSCTALKSCPDLCWCLGANPTVCTRCKDVNRNVSTVCRSCNSGWLWLSDFELCVNNSQNLPITNNPTYNGLICPKNCFCDASYKCQQCTDSLRDPAYNCTGCISGYRIVDGTCKPYCVPGCICQTTCVSCINPNYGVESECVCPKGQTLNQYGVCAQMYWRG
jgi:hypothetical protein